MVNDKDSIFDGADGFDYKEHAKEEAARAPDTSAVGIILRKGDKSSQPDQLTTDLERFKQGFKGLLAEITQFQRIWLNDPRTPVRTAEGMIAKTLESEFWRRLMVRTFEALKEGLTTDEILDTIGSVFAEVLAEVQNKDMSESIQYSRPSLKPLIANPDRRKNLPDIFERELTNEIGEKARTAEDVTRTVRMARLGEKHQGALDKLRQTLRMKFIQFDPGLAKDHGGEGAIQDTRKEK